MKTDKITEELEIPAGISVKVEKDDIVIKKNNEEIKRKIHSLIKIKIAENKLIISSEKNQKKEKKTIGTFVAHVKNIFQGLDTPFKYRLQAASVHFPMTLTQDHGTNEIIVKNFLGEKKERRIKIIPGVNVKIIKDIIELESSNIENAGQSASNIEKGTRVRNRDRRIFQDGIFIIEKPGRSFL
jgi:large subunit ribosomal protein L6